METFLIVMGIVWLCLLFALFWDSLTTRITTAIDDGCTKIAKAIREKK
jgi:hypothetical protein